MSTNLPNTTNTTNSSSAVGTNATIPSPATARAPAERDEGTASRQRNGEKTSPLMNC